jgi:hypothetical protein
LSPEGACLYPAPMSLRYDVALEALTRLFEKNALPLAPPPGERADLLEVHEGAAAGKTCAVCARLISGERPSPGERPSVEYVYQSVFTLSFHGDCHAAWVNKSASWHREHP